MSDGEPETAVSASLQKIKSIKNQQKHFFFKFFYFINSQTSDSFVNHFDGHFAYLKTLDFSFKETHKRTNSFPMAPKLRITVSELPVILPVWTLALLSTVY